MLEPFEFGFMQRAMVTAALVGGITAAIGVFVVLRHLAYIGHGLAHSIFGGAVISFVSGINFFVGASIWGAASVVLINLVSRRPQIGGDAAIGIITTAAFAIGIAVISRARTFTRDFEAALFGEILGISQQDLWITVGMVVLIAAVLIAWWKPLVFITFDRAVAGAYGISVGWVELVFAFALAATVVASLQVLGVTLIAAALGDPARRRTPADRLVSAPLCRRDDRWRADRLARRLHLVVRRCLIGRDGRADAGRRVRARAGL